MKKKIEGLLIFISCCSICVAQQVVSSGGHAVKSEISMDWILGGSLSDIPSFDADALNRLRLEQMMESEISVKLYPNPATDFINIEITPVDTGRLIIELYNNKGVKVLNTVAVNQPVMQVNISNFPSGAYFLKVFLPHIDLPFRVEKIIKK